MTKFLLTRGVHLQEVSNSEGLTDSVRHTCTCILKMHFPPGKLQKIGKTMFSFNVWFRVCVRISLWSDRTVHVRQVHDVFSYNVHD